MTWTTWVRSKVELQPAEQRDGTPWPMPAQSVVRAWADEDYVIDVELRLGRDDQPIVTGLAIRRGVPLEPRSGFKQSEPRWPKDAEPRSVRPRDVKRLPLSQIAKAAVTWVSALELDPGSAKRTLELDRARRTLRPPRTSPREDPDYYRKLLLVHNELVARREPSPAKKLAEQMGKPLSTVHVHLHRARRKLAADA